MKHFNTPKNWEDSLLAFYFSFRGFLNRSQFFVALATLYSFSRFVASFDLLPLTILGYLLVFYASLAVIQRRCRDIKQKGSVFIICFSVSYFATCYLNYLKEYNLVINDYIKNFLGIFIGLYILACVFLQVMPGKKEKDINLTSPLLKHPPIYFIICLVVFLAVYLLNTAL